MLSHRSRSSKLPVLRSCNSKLKCCKRGARHRSGQPLRANRRCSSALQLTLPLTRKFAHCKLPSHLHTLEMTSFRQALLEASLCVTADSFCSERFTTPRNCRALHSWSARSFPAASGAPSLPFLCHEAHCVMPEKNLEQRCSESNRA